MKTWTTEAVTEFFNAHWTVRRYRPVPMPAEHLEVILAAAQRAPTDATAQMYSFIRLVNPQLRQEMAELAGNAHIATASEAFVICADVHRLNALLEAGGEKPGTYPHIAVHFAIGDAVMAAQNMLVASEMLGYRGCWIGGVINSPQEISEKLKLPDGVFAFAAMTIGVPDEPAQHRPRLPRAMIVHQDEYRQASAAELLAGAEGMSAISQRGNWIQTLARYFAAGGAMETRESKLAALLKQKIFGGK